MRVIESTGRGAAWVAEVWHRVNVEYPRNREEELVPRCDQLTIETMCGLITNDELDQGVDLEDFLDVLALGMPADCDVDLQLMLPRREVIKIFAYVEEGLAEIDFVDWGLSSSGQPVGLVGRWVDFDWDLDG